MIEHTSFKILSHACLFLKRGSTALIMDPWLLGSCYWRSWWNYPDPEINEEELKLVTHVLISHIHWDHWHGISLKKYFKNRQFLIPKEPKTRSFDDLVKLRLGEVNFIQHGKSFYLGDQIKITIYQFGLFQNDSAVVIETPECKILNANDAKIAGMALKQIIKKHGPFDFALRSHSTANFRACISIDNDLIKSIDDNEHYSRSFQLFMNAVKPKYAIPFASNHCHLHQDTYHFNNLITNPLKLKNWLDVNNGLESSQFTIMLPGSSWNSHNGFSLKELEPFKNLEVKLADYQQKKHAILSEYYDYEAKQTLPLSFLTKHEAHLKTIPWIMRSFLRKTPIAYKVKCNNKDSYFAIDISKCLIKPIDESVYQVSAIKIEWPIVVLRQSIGLNMYSHAFISKRVKFKVNNKNNLKKLIYFIGCLEKIEHEVYPIRFNYFKKLFLAYCKRWREVLVYFIVIKELIISRKSLPAIEEVILRKSKMKINKVS